ncbi:MAG: hypothetical protein ACRDIV_02730 [Ktedonobacteraceae bacterium]
MATESKQDDRQGRLYYTAASQAASFVYSSGDPCGRHALTLYMLNL